jgi:SAM-dependent methyltransferase
MELKQHWERVYTEKDSTNVSWYRPHLDKSLELIDGLRLGPDARIVDIGGGASTLVDDLLERGFRDLTVLDLSAAALEVAKRRLGDRADLVRWEVGDATEINLGCDAFDVWHDRAVFHFLTEPGARRRYVERACCSLRTGGHIILATFALDGPEKCSGLPVARYSAEGLRRELGPAYEVVAEVHDRHETPFGTEQSFVYCLCDKATDCPT